MIVFRSLAFHISFRDLSIRAKIRVTLPGVGLVSIGTTGWIGHSSTQKSLESEAFGKLAGVQPNKSNALTETLRKSVQRFRIEEEPMAGKEPSPQEPVPVAATSRQ